MPETTTRQHELEELQEQQRATAQLRQSEEFTMGGHVRNKLRTMRNRLRKTFQEQGQLTEGAEADDDMQILARDISFPQPEQKPAKSKWPLAAAVALGLGIPGTTGIVMAPTIINALKGEPPAAVVPDQPVRPEYAPILLPGKPKGVK